jgi:hypothetical protein
LGEAFLYMVLAKNKLVRRTRTSFYPLSGKALQTKIADTQVAVARLFPSSFEEKPLQAIVLEKTPTALRT